MDSQMLDILQNPQNWSEEEVQENNRRVIEHIQTLENSFKAITVHVGKAIDSNRLALLDLEKDAVGGARDEVRNAQAELQAIYTEPLVKESN